MDTAANTDPPPDSQEISVEDFLAEMAREQGRELHPDGRPYAGGGAFHGPQGGTSARPPRLRYAHKAMCDLLLIDPSLSQNKLAAIFGRTPGWISTIINSDAFQAMLASRRAELIDPQITMSLQERASAVAKQSMQVISEKLSRPTNEVSDQLALRAFEVASKALGMGQAAPPPPPPPAAEYLPQIAERLLRLQGKSSAEDATIVERAA